MGMFIQELGGPTWLVIATSFVVFSAELCGVAFVISNFQRWLDDG
jgi:hypothetical protein